MENILSIPPDAGKECNEFAAMTRRMLLKNSPEYSAGHRRMYDSTIELLRGNPCSVLEVGFGIGYGLTKMLKTLRLSSYYGVEPCQDSFDYVEREIAPLASKVNGSFKLDCKYWSEVRLATPADYTFCIEVIEHIPEVALSDFLWKLRQHTTKNLFLSTPDSSKSSHGCKTQAEWVEVLRRHGFSAVAVAHQWTTLFICN